MTTASIGPLLIGAHRNARSDADNSTYWAKKTNALALALLMAKEPNVRSAEIDRKKDCILKALDAGVRTRVELYAALDESGAVTVAPKRKRRTF